MKVEAIACGPFVNESERTALGRIKSGLISIAGADEWILLTNLLFSSNKKRQSDEIDIVAIGPPGVRLIEVKHWNARWIRKVPRRLEKEADKLTTKAKRVGTELRKLLRRVGRVDGAILLTPPPGRVAGVTGKLVNGVGVYSLKEWKNAVGLSSSRVLTASDVRRLGRHLAPEEVRLAVENALSLPGIERLKNLPSADSPFHRVFSGVRSRSNEPVVIHLYDLSAEERNAEVRARRECETLRLLGKAPWAPSLVDTYQPLRNYDGELYFFTMIDPSVPSIGERMDDPGWTVKERLHFSRSAIQALQDLHAGLARSEPLVHRNLTLSTIRVTGDNSPLLTGFHHARLPMHPTIAKTASEVRDWDESTAPEVKRAGDLGSAGQLSDTYSLCHCLARLFKGREDPASRKASVWLSCGLEEEPSNRAELRELEAEFASLLGESAEPPPPNADAWAKGQVIRFRGNVYRILERMGSGGIGIAFHVEKIGQPDGEFLGDYIGKAVVREEIGKKVLRAYERAHPHLRHPLATIFEVAHEWRANSFVALMNWIPGVPLDKYRSDFRVQAERNGNGSADDAALRWLRQSCEALALLHDHGLTHGDVSPSNLIVSKGDVIVTDYDCVSKVGEPTGSPGTMEYCAPTSKQPPRASASDDVFALAASFYHVLFDERPFRRNGDLVKGLGLVWDRASRQEYPSVKAFLDRATHPDPDLRYGSATDALNDLQMPNPVIPSKGEAPPALDDEIPGPPDQLSSQGGQLPVATATPASRSPARTTAPGGGPDSDGAHATEQPADNPPEPVRSAPDRSAPGQFYAEARQQLVDWLKSQLIGPATGAEELNMSPLHRFPVGVLHPVEPDGIGSDPASSSGNMSEEDPFLENVEESAIQSDDGHSVRTAQPVRRRRYAPPSSVGFSFFVQGHPRLEIAASAVAYQSTEIRDESGRYIRHRYKREPLKADLEWELGVSEESPQHCDRLGIDVRCRHTPDGSIVTVTLCNRQELDPKSWTTFRDRAEKALFEVSLECGVRSGTLKKFPRVQESLLTEEERELELQYKDKRIYAVGHGAAVNWEVRSGREGRIWSEFMPEVEVPLVSTALHSGNERVLGMKFLAKALTAQLVVDLTGFVNEYESWIQEQERVTHGPSEIDTASRITGRMRVASARMRTGIELLAKDHSALESFRVANRVMLDQMQQYDDIQGRSKPIDDYKWRPFQLAFLLTVIESAVREDSQYRKVLDLIWFPTGGGKTEAYLGLIAFLITWRRLEHKSEGGGTAILMRYTLRLLTRQQFERASRMIFSLELERRRKPEVLGFEPISIGIWVGQSVCPNVIREARKLQDAIENGARIPNGLMLEACPWCGEEFKPTSYRSSRIQFTFHCVNNDCDFGRTSDPLPCNVIDEALYSEPPSLLIGTIDKFARLAWEERAGAFFGTESRRPPELIIQDEVHLITGPLGSVAGLYEAALDTIVSVRGVRPKYVASTATIRMASEQVRRLYGRGLAVFPPPGLSCDDNYFAHVDKERPARLYVGYLAPMLDQRHSLAPLASALLCGPRALVEGRSSADRDALLEAWSTQVVYHSTLHDVGSSHNAYAVDVRDWTKRFFGELKEASRLSGDGHGLALGTVANPGRRELMQQAMQASVAQLTSIANARENAETFERLQRRIHEDGHLDVLLATNMLSVGVDVSRLSLMVMNGQPLSTAEYIQASSRVGRSEVPGLIVANYFRHQARSLSHYELFRPYHESFYRFVEPSSVTPHTFPVRTRALHAALVIVLRHSYRKLQANTAAASLDRYDSRITAAVEALKRRLAEAEPEHSTAPTARQIDSLLEQWHAEKERCGVKRQSLVYYSKDGSASSLLRSHNESTQGLWPTLHSMRDVEQTSVLKET